MKILDELFKQGFRNISSIQDAGVLVHNSMIVEDGEQVYVAEVS